MDGSVVACTSCGTRNRVPAAAGGSPRCGRCKQVLAWVTDSDDETFAEVAGRSPVPAVVDFWAPWCGPCRTVSPILEGLAAEFAGRVKLVKVNVDKAPRLHARFRVQGVPTLVMLRDGREVARTVGAAPQGHLRRWIAAALEEPSRGRTSPAP